ncbi:hypothetical protein TMEC54S_00201 [Thauera mechernichensis]
MPINRAPFDAELIQAVNEHQFGLSDHPFARSRCPSCASGSERPVFDEPGLLVASTHGLLCLDCGHLDPAPALHASIAEISCRVRWAQVLYRNRAVRINALIEQLLTHPFLEAHLRGEGPGAETTIKGASIQALASLRRYALLNDGVETRPGRTFEITSDWALIEDHPPPRGWSLQILYQCDSVLDPWHPAFGVGWHVVRVTLDAPTTLAKQLHEVRGRARYWRHYHVPLDSPCTSHRPR